MLIREQDVLFADLDVTIRERGVLIAERVLPIRDLDVLVVERGLPIRERGVPFAERGLPMGERGVAIVDWQTALADAWSPCDDGFLSFGRRPHAFDHPHVGSQDSSAPFTDSYEKSDDPVDRSWVAAGSVAGGRRRRRLADVPGARRSDRARGSNARAVTRSPRIARWEGVECAAWQLL